MNHIKERGWVGVRVGGGEGTVGKPRHPYIGGWIGRGAGQTWSVCLWREGEGRAKQGGTYTVNVHFGWEASSTHADGTPLPYTIRGR